MENDDIDLDRRKFLLATKTVGVVGAAAILMGRSEAVQLPAETSADNDVPTGGYRETEHIRKYYYTASYF